MEEEQIDYWKPVRVIIALVLIFIIVLMIIPNYYVKLDPEPKPVQFQDVGVEVKLRNQSIKVNSTSEFAKFVQPKNPEIKYIANRISTQACESSTICYAKAQYYYVRDNINYIKDPIRSEYIEPPIEVFASGGGDCESGSILLASLLESIGVNAQLVFTTNHAYVRIKLDEAQNKYKQDGWIYLDWTCDECEFGEVPWSNQERYYLEVP